MSGSVKGTRKWKLTPRRRQLRDFACAFRSRHGRLPNGAEMMRGINTRSWSYTQRTLQMLIERGEMTP